MPASKKEQQGHEEKEWDNPVDPANTSDDRDKEQLLRQYREAKRRKDNLTTEEDQTEEDQNEQQKTDY